ncbi:MAG: hypothetical protein Q9221_005400 [Calogaya cf. arnoldii]
MAAKSPNSLGPKYPRLARLQHLRFHNHPASFSPLQHAMSFGGPGGLQKASKPIPPERGSFPLDNLMAPDELKNLGFHEEDKKEIQEEQGKERGKKEGGDVKNTR